MGSPQPTLSNLNSAYFYHTDASPIAHKIVAAQQWIDAPGAVAFGAAVAISGVAANHRANTVKIALNRVCRILSSPAEGVRRR